MTEKNEIRLRRAVPADCDLYYEWVNDPDVRASAFNTAQIPYNNHCAWFKAKLADENTVLYVAEIDGLPLGQLRVDCKGTEGEIDISVARRQRGKGYAAAILQAGCSAVQSDTPKCRSLIGKVKLSNMASQRAFIAAGFREICREADHIRYQREIPGSM